MKKRVFISYSTLSDQPNVADADVSKLRDLLTERLHDAGYEPLVDRQIRSGEVWRYQIYRWIAVCDAAVVLLTRSALKAPWVRKETELLMWRWTLEGQRAPLILPYRLGDVKPEEIPKEEFSATFINQLQAPALSDDALVEDVVDRLKTLSTAARPSSPFRKIESLIASHLRNLSEDDLDEVLASLGVDDDSFEPISEDREARKRAQLAAALLDLDQPRLLEFLQDRTGSMRREGAEALVNWVASFRIDANDACVVYRRSLSIPREVAITSRYPLLGQHYVNRGYLQATPMRVLAPVIRVDEKANDQAAVDDVLKQLEDLLLPSGASLPSRAAVKNYLKNAKTIRFVALRMLSDDPVLRARLKAELENVVFLFFTRDDEGRVELLADTATVEVDQQRDETLLVDYLDALDTAQR